MRFIDRCRWLGFFTLTATVPPLACAHTLEEALPDQPRSPDESSTTLPDQPDVVSGLDAGLDAVMPPIPCSSSNLCIAPLPMDHTLHIASVWGSGARDVYAVGSDGSILHYDGAVWEKALTGPNTYGPFMAQSVWLQRPDDVWVADGDRIRHGTGWKGPTETKWTYYRYTDRGLVTAIGGNANTVWIGRNTMALLGRQALDKCDGWGDAGPSNKSTTGPKDSIITAVTVPSPTEVWAVGVCRVAKEPDRDCALRASRPLTDGGTSPNWTIEEHDSRSNRMLFGVWADEHAVWIVGEGGTLRRMIASEIATNRFELIDGPVLEDLYGVFGFGQDDVWAVGAASTVIHWDGTSWTKIPTPFDDATEKPSLRAIWGSSPTDLWIAGDNGTMLHLQEVSK
jgi:hypothetical protein